MAKRVRVKNPGGRLMVLNKAGGSGVKSTTRKRTNSSKRRSTAAAAKRRNGVRRTKRRNPAVNKQFVFQAIWVAIGAVATKLLIGPVSNYLPVLRAPLFNVAAKLGIAIALGKVMELVGPQSFRQYGDAIALGGASVAASDGAAIIFPAARTFFVQNTDTALPSADEVSANDFWEYDNGYSDIITVDDAGSFGDIITPNYANAF